MIDTKRTNILSCVALCTGMGFASPVQAHDGLHQMTYLQSLLHELAWADTLASTFAIAAVSAIAAWRFCQRKAARTTL